MLEIKDKKGDTTLKIDNDGNITIKANEIKLQGGVTNVN